MRKETLRPRERWLAALRLQPVDRLPFWPKLDRSYARAQAAPFRGMGPDALHAWLGSDNHVGIPSALREVRKKTSVAVSAAGGTRTTVFKTPAGRAARVDRFDEGSQSWHPVQMPVRDVEDVKLMTEWYSDITVEPDEELLEQAGARAGGWGADAVTAVTIGESPLMCFVEWLAGLERANYLLLDHPGEVQALFDAMHRVLLEKTRLICERHPADLLYMSENTSTTLISPGQYRAYCRRHIRDYAQIAAANGRLLVLHMCGHLRRLLDDLARLPVAAFEAFTSPPVGDTTLADGRRACPDKCLIGGTNAALWMRPAGEIIAQLERDLDALPHHRGLVVTSAGVMTPLCPPETIRTVSEWVRRYEARN